MTSRVEIGSLKSDESIILPSMLLCDFGNLEREVRRLEQAGVRALHLDVMDGSFVPNFSYGLTIVKAIRQLTELPLDVHLMMVHPEQYVVQFCDVGANIVTFHAEAVDDPIPVLKMIRQAGAAAGLALNPGTPVDAAAQAIEHCDLVLVMTVEAGFGGQSFMVDCLEKLAPLRALSKEVILEVDGGINNASIGSCVTAGANWLVVGSAIFGHSDYKKAVTELRQHATSAAGRAT